MTWDEDLDDDFAVDAVMPCPLCGESIFDDSASCPHCGEFIVQSTSFLEGKSLWFRFLWITMITILIWQMLGLWF
ncbi:MAG: hypothetical protein AAGA30_03855 [Planctomycetota bacterium]